MGARGLGQEARVHLADAHGRSRVDSVDPLVPGGECLRERDGPRVDDLQVLCAIQARGPQRARIDAHDPSREQVRETRGTSECDGRRVICRDPRAQTQRRKRRLPGLGDDGGQQCGAHARASLPRSDLDVDPCPGGVGRGLRDRGRAHNHASHRRDDGPGQRRGARLAQQRACGQLGGVAGVRQHLGERAIVTVLPRADGDGRGCGGAGRHGGSCAGGDVSGRTERRRSNRVGSPRSAGSDPIGDAARMTVSAVGGTVRGMSAHESDQATHLAQQAAQILNDAAGIDRHDIALVLGSGWGGAADLLGETIADTAAADVPGFHAPAVPGHGGRLRTVRLPGGAHALVLGSRRHFYEGRDAQATAHGVRVAAAAGCTTLVLTNGCGGLNPDYAPGSVVLINDHINLTGATPLTGANFVDLTDLYSSRLRGIAREIDPQLHEGVYVQFSGPQYETPAEVRMAKILGGDLVGMSTALEAIAARAAGLELMGLSLVTNLAAGIQETPLSHEEVIEAGQAAGPRISQLLAQIVTRIAED